MQNDETRLYTELSDNHIREEYRSEYRRDYARVIHSASFRRLQNKTQLFPGQESDFFRNRLTHSLEVAQIAKTIAYKLLHDNSALPIEPDVCEIAGLIHDLGHPPFGHNGERALNICMSTYGGFEGNAQTLRIITRLEKKVADEEYHKEYRDNLRFGLNLTARVIASALKYDCAIPNDYNGDDVPKGYYESEKDVVSKVKELLITKDFKGKFKTIECQIMDIADDIAYSTYDIEDAFKADFLTPMDMMAASDSIFEQIAEKISKNGSKTNLDACKDVLYDLFAQTWSDKINEQQKIRKNSKMYGRLTLNTFADIHKISKDVASNGYMRTDFTSQLVKNFVNGVKIEIDRENPLLSRVFLETDIDLQVNVLKHFAYVCLINSSRLKVAEHRGEEIITSIFKVLCENKGLKLISEDFQRIIEKRKIPKRRVVCDYIAGMTDRHALELYSKLFSENPQSIFKPF